MFNWQDFLGNLSGYKLKYERCSTNFAECSSNLKDIGSKLIKAENTIKQLELLVPRPAPPEIDYVVEKDTLWVQQVLDGMGLGIIRLGLDANYYLTNQTNFLNIVAWDWVDSIKYVAERFDCENFAFAFKSHVDMYFHLNQVAVVIDYKSGHGYNLVIFPNGKVMVLEPQSDNLYVWTKRPEAFYSLKGAIVLL